jgi:succinyl-CoA synthetase beta subunit
VPSDKTEQAVAFFHSLYRAYVEIDASLLEINPLVKRGDGSLLALDAKVSFDDNALYRHSDVRELRDENEEDPKELRAAKFDLSYIALNGTIGCMVNGAGWQWRRWTSSIITAARPRTSATWAAAPPPEKVAEAFKIILLDPNVKAVFINIFGGIMRCDVLAQGVVDAAKVVKPKVPLVVRLEGTNVEKGREILAQSDVAIIAAKDMTDGARKAGRSRHAARGEAMSILLSKKSRVVTQGMGKTGLFHLKGCREYGTQMVAGVRPGKGGETLEDTPLFDTGRSGGRRQPAATFP